METKQYTYSQKTGILACGGLNIGVGYSGHGHGLNNPAMQDVQKVGPIPMGFYTIGPAHTHPRLGPVVMFLTPDETNNMYGRGDFFFHGDNAEMNHTGSEGCPVQGKPARESVAANIGKYPGSDRLEVIE
jgi:hypothetical protein